MWFPSRRQTRFHGFEAGRQLGWLSAFHDGLNNIRGQTGDSKHPCEVGGVLARLDYWSGRPRVSL